MAEILEIRLQESASGAIREGDLSGPPRPPATEVIQQPNVGPQSRTSQPSMGTVQAPSVASVASAILLTHGILRQFGVDPSRLAEAMQQQTGPQPPPLPPEAMPQNQLELNPAGRTVPVFVMNWPPSMGGPDGPPQPPPLPIQEAQLVYDHPPKPVPEAKPPVYPGAPPPFVVGVPEAKPIEPVPEAIPLPKPPPLPPEAMPPEAMPPEPEPKQPRGRRRMTDEEVEQAVNDSIMARENQRRIDAERKRRGLDEPKGPSIASQIGSVGRQVAMSNVAGKIAAGDPGAFASALTAATVGLGPFGTAVSAATMAVTGLFSGINSAADRYAAYSPQLAVAQAQAEVKQIMGDIRRAQTVGPQLAQFVDKQAEMKQKFDDLMIRLLPPFLKVAEAFMDRIIEILDTLNDPEKMGRGIGASILNFLGTINVLGIGKVFKGLADHVKSIDDKTPALKEDITDFMEPPPAYDTEDVKRPSFETTEGPQNDPVHPILGSL